MTLRPAIVTYDPADFQIPPDRADDIMPPDIKASGDPWDDVTIVKRQVLPPTVAAACYICARRGPRLYVNTSGVTVCETCGDELNRDDVPRPR